MPSLLLGQRHCDGLFKNANWFGAWYGRDMKRSMNSLPLHYWRASAWLFQEMKRLSASIMEIIVLEFGLEEFPARVADPLRLQTLGCVVGFDRRSSGLITTLCRALKEGRKFRANDAWRRLLFCRDRRGGTYCKKEKWACTFSFRRPRANYCR